MADRVAGVVRPLVDGGWSKGLMVGVVQGGQKSYFPFGSVGDEANRTPDENTVFEIGSITKVFTALLLADMTARGEVSLDDPVAEYLPEDWKLPTPGGRPITLGSLADHTSGLPFVPANFWKAGDQIYDADLGGKRWQEYSEAQIREYLESPQPAPDERRPYVYSNLGAGLLGHALARKAGKSLDDLMAERICQPLGMERTSFDLDTSGPGHDVDGRPAAAWVAGESVLRGAFALRSTCADLLRFAEAALDPSGFPLAEALALSQKPRATINELEQSALGWKVNKYGVVYTSGTTGGFRCALFLHPKGRTAVVLLANTQVGGATGGRASLFDTVAGSLLNVSLGVAPLPVEIPQPVKPDSDLLDYVGTWRPVEGQGPSVPVRLDNGQLVTVGPGGIEMILWPLAKDVFFARGYIAEFKFLRDQADAITGLELIFEGRQSKLKRNANPQP